MTSIAETCWRCDAAPAATNVGLCLPCKDILTSEDKQPEFRGQHMILGVLDEALDFTLQDVRGLAAFMDGLTWPCHVCHDIRPDVAISVHKSSHRSARGLEFETCVRYCNDRQACIDAAPVIGAEWALALI